MYVCNKIKLSFKLQYEQFLNTYIIPFSSRIFLVEKLVCAPEPFQSCTGFGSKVTMTPYSSANLCRIYRATQRSSAAVTPVEGPTWNSHCEGITSALVPAIGTPAYRQHLRQIQPIVVYNWAKVLLRSLGYNSTNTLEQIRTSCYKDTQLYICHGNKRFCDLKNLQYTLKYVNVVLRHFNCVQHRHSFDSVYRLCKKQCNNLFFGLNTENSREYT